MPWLISSELIRGPCSEMIMYNDRYCITIKKAGKKWATGTQIQNLHACYKLTEPTKRYMDCILKSKLGYKILFLNAASSYCYTDPEQSPF